MSRFSHPGTVLAVAMLVASCGSSGPKLIASSSVNGKVVKVFSTGDAPDTANTEQTNDTTKVTVGSHVIVIKSDGHVSVDGKETAYGPFKELDVTVGDAGKIEVKVVN